jgi:hypothetical protein
MNKVCSHCKAEKNESCFDKDKSHPDGLRCWCKDCRKAQWLANREENLKRKHLYYQKNKNHNIAYAHEYAEKNKDTIAMKRKERESRPDVRKMIREYWQKRRNSEPMIRLNASMRAAVYHSIKSNKDGNSWQSLLGYTLHELKSKIENQFSTGMSWANYGEWEIDHKVPLSAHNFQSFGDIDFQRAWDINNLRPLWKKENRAKGDRLVIPFQPSLAIGAR